MHIFIINLEHATQRRQLMTEQLSRLNLPHEFISGVNGRALSVEQFDELCDMDVVRKCPEWLTPGAIGASLSHLKTYRTIVEREVGIALILEDDVIVNERLPQVLSAVESRCRTLLDHELMLLYSQSFKRISFSESGGVRLADDYRAMYSLDPAKLMSAIGYVVSNAVARRMLAAGEPVRAASDAWGHYLRAGAFDNIRCVVPYPVFPALMESCIGYADRNTLSFKLKHFVEEHNIFPFAGLIRLKRKRLHLRMTEYEITSAAPPSSKIRNIADG